MPEKCTARYREAPTDLTLELTQKSAGFRHSFPPSLLTSVAGLVPDLPGVMAYGDTAESALRKAKTIALQVLADMIESGEEVPQPLKVLFIS